MTSATQESVNQGQGQPVPNTMLFANGSLDRFGPPKVERFTRKNDAGDDVKVALYTGVPIFRSGTFADSRGYEREWLPEQMSQMAANFDLLKNSGIFTDIPVRAGHPTPFGNSIKDVIGYFTAVRTEERISPANGEKYTYFLADYEILDPDADAKIQSGLYKNRSSEIGTYFTNAPTAEHYPVMMGVAYVDIPAVEGLNGFASANSSEQFSIQMEEPDVTGTQEASKVVKPGLGSRAVDSAEFTIGGVTTTDFARVQAYISDLESQRDTAVAERESFKGRVTALEEFKSGVIKSGREEKITNLGKEIDGVAPRLTGPEVTAAIAFSAALDDDTFTAYLATLEASPAREILGQHGRTNHDGSQTNSAKKESEKASAQLLADNREVVAGFKQYSKMSDEAIKETAAYKTVIALDPTFSL